MNIKKKLKAFGIILLLNLVICPSTLAATTIGNNITTGGNLSVQGNLLFSNGAGAGFILQSDALGNATWLNAAAWDKNNADDLTTSTVFSGDVSGSYSSTTVTDLTISGEAQGDVLYFNGTNWVRLAAGTSGQFLQTQGAGANPQWAAAAGSGDVTDVGDVASGAAFTATAGNDGNSLWFEGTSADGNEVQLTAADPGADVTVTIPAATGTLLLDANIGTSVQAWDVQLDDIAGLTPTNNNIIIGDGANWQQTSTANWDKVSTDDLTTATSFSGDVSGSYSSTTVTDLTISGEAQGDVLYFNGTNWVRLAAGTSGQFLQTQGAGANPQWAAGGGGETNTASNQGVGGVGPFLQKTGADLEFKNINAGSSKVNVSNDAINNEIDIDITEANLTLDNLGGTLSIAKGGTGATDATTARSNLGLAIGSNVQAWDSYLDDIASITAAQGEVLYFDGSDWVTLSPGTSGQVLQTQGAGADPQWATVSAAAQNLFETISTPLGTNPVADASTDTLALTAGTGMYVTGNAGTDTINFSLSGALAAIAGLSSADSDFIVGNGTTWVAESGNTARTSLGLGTADSPQFTGLTLTGDLGVQGNSNLGNGSTDRTTITGELLLGSIGADPAGSNGLTYYNSTTNKFRCYESGAWKDCDTTGASATLQTAYDNGASITTAAGIPIVFNLTSGNFNATGSGAVNLTPTSASQFTSSGALTLTAGATSTWSTSSGNLNLTSASALAMQGGAASSFSTTTGNITLQPAGTGTTAYVQIGAGGAGSTTPDLLILDKKSDAGDPAGTNGAIYYNTNTNKFRCYQSGAWTDCVSSAGTNYWSRTGTNLSPATAGDDILLNAGETLTISDLTAGSVVFTGTSGLITQDNTNFFWDNTNKRLGVGTNAPAYAIDTTGAIRTGRNGTDGQLRIYSEQGPTDYEIIFQPPAAMTQNTTYTMPANDGNSGQFLQTDGNGNLSWVRNGWFGSTTRLKLLPADFISDDNDDNATIATDGTSVTASSGTTQMAATIAIPTGFQATAAMVYGSDTTNTVTVYANDITNNTTATNLGAGVVGTEINITDTASSTTNYLTIYVNTGNADSVYGGYVTLSEQ